MGYFHKRQVIPRGDLSAAGRDYRDALAAPDGGRGLAAPPGGRELWGRLMGFGRSAGHCLPPSLGGWTAGHKQAAGASGGRRAPRVPAGRPRRGRLRPAGGSCVLPTVITSGPTRPGSRPEPTNRQALAAADRGRRVPPTHPPNHHAHTHPTRNPRAVPAWKAHVRCVKFTLCKCTHIPTAPFAAIRCYPLTHRIRWRK